MIFDPVLTRLFLIDAFNEREFNLLCQSYFPDVHLRFSAEMTRGERVQLLINHCDRFGRIPQLLAALENAKPDQYKKRFRIRI